MIKKFITCSMLIAGLLFSGCEDSDGEDAVGLQQMLDKGDYQGVISKISVDTTKKEEQMALAAAYVQKAGLGLADLIELIAEDSEDSEAFAGFIKNIKTKSSKTALTDLENATFQYKKIVADCKSKELKGSDKDACLYSGLAQTLKAATTIGYLAGDIAKFGKNGAVDNKLKASACAMQYAISGSSDCTIVSNGNMLFQQSGKTYESISVIYGVETFENLITTTAPKQTVLTNGFCSKNDFSTRTEIKVGGYHVCPVVETSDTKELTTEDLIVDALNSGFDAISGIATEDMQEDIDEFKCEVLGGTYNSWNGCNKAINQKITPSQIIDYLNNKNK